MRLFFIALLSLLLAIPAFAMEPKPGDPVKEVRVRGNLRVETEKILTIVKTEAGKPFSPDQLRQDIRAIYALGFFSDALVEFDDEARLTFVLLERPSLRKWEIRENDEVSTDDMSDKLKIDTGEILRDGAVDNAVKIIREFLMEKGFYLAEVTPEIVPVEGGKNQVDVFFNVIPHEKVLIRQIHISGATDKEEKEIKKGMALGEKSFWSFISDSGSFKRANLSRDVEWIRIHYLNKGYAQVAVGEPLVQVTPDLRSIEISIPVEPGRIYHIRSVNFTGDSQFSREKLLETAGIEPGGLFRADDVFKARSELDDLHSNEGYAFAQVDPRPTNFTEDGLLDLEFNIRKGAIYTIGRIDMTGNSYTRDRVMRREMRLAEGDKYNRKAMVKSDRALKKLGFFKSVAITENRRPDQPVIDLNVEVQEQMTGTFSAGAGYSSQDGIMGTFSVSKANLFGYGYQLRGDIGLSKTKQSYSITFNNTRLFDTEIYLGFDVYKTTSQYTEYDRDSEGFKLRLGRNFFEDWHGRVTYAWDHSDLKGVCTYEEFVAGQCDNLASTAVQDQAGITITSSLTGMVTYDTRDNYMEALEGNYTQLTTEWAGSVLGGDVDFLKYGADIRHHFKFFGVTSLMFRGRAGLIDPIGGSDIPVYERFAVGGITTIRGFGNREIGPVDKGKVDPDTGDVLRPPSGEVVGGDKYFVGNVEYVFPIFSEIRLKGVVFYDFGNAWDTDEGWFSSKLRDSAGYGVRWFSPVGPLRLEYGYNLHPQEGEKRSQWEFLIGGYF